jgi:hypothetical protein
METRRFSILVGETGLTLGASLRLADWPVTDRRILWVWLQLRNEECGVVP